MVPSNLPYATTLNTLNIFSFYSFYLLLGIVAAWNIRQWLSKRRTVQQMKVQLLGPKERHDLVVCWIIALLIFFFFTTLGVSVFANLSKETTHAWYAIAITNFISGGVLIHAGCMTIQFWPLRGTHLQLGVALNQPLKLIVPRRKGQAILVELRIVIQSMVGRRAAIGLHQGIRYTENDEIIFERTTTCKFSNRGYCTIQPDKEFPVLDTTANAEFELYRKSILEIKVPGDDFRSFSFVLPWRLRKSPYEASARDSSPRR